MADWRRPIPARFVLAALLAIPAGGCPDDASSGGPDAGGDTDADTDADTDGDSDADAGDDTDTSEDGACDTECEDGSWEIDREFGFTIDEVDAGEPPCEFSFEDVTLDGFPCDWLDPAFVTVLGDGEAIPYSSDLCVEEPGWWLWFVSEIDGPPAELRICGDPCARVQSGEWSEITVQMWRCVP